MMFASHANLGLVYADQGRLDEAIREVQAALQINPNDVLLLCNLGVFYRQQGRIDEAIHEFQAVLRINPDYAEAHLELGMLYQQQDRIDEAIREFQAALGINPDYAEAHRSLGVAYGRQGSSRRGDPRVHWRRCGVNPDHAEAHYALGVIYGQQGHHDEAIRDTRRRCGSTRMMPTHSIWAWSSGGRAAPLRQFRRPRRRSGLAPPMLQRTSGWAWATDRQGRARGGEVRECQAALADQPRLCRRRTATSVPGSIAQQGRADEAVQ